MFLSDPHIPALQSLAACPFLEVWASGSRNLSGFKVGFGHFLHLVTLYPEQRIKGVLLMLPSSAPFLEAAREQGERDRCYTKNNRMSFFLASSFAI